MADRELTVRILGDAKSFERAVGKAKGGLRGLGSGVAGVAKIGAAAGLGLGAAGVGIGIIGAKALEAGGKLELLDQKAQTVFGDQLPVIQKWADANAHAMGLTRTEATAAAAGLADLLIPMKFTREEAAAMSTDIVGLSGALSEWSGGQRSAEEVAEILAKAMLGERDSLKSLGISIMEADVQARLLAKGQAELTGELLQQAKAVATQELIFEKSTDAQAAFAEGSGKLARTQAELMAQIGELKEQIIRALMPTLQRVAEWLSSTGIPLLIEFGEWLGPKLERAGEMANAALDAFGKWFDDHRDEIVGFLTTAREVAEELWHSFLVGLDTIMPPLRAFGEWILSNKPVLIAAMIAIGAAIVLSLGPVSGAVAAITGIVIAIGWMKENWQKVANGVIGIVEWMTNKIIDGMNKAISVVRDTLNAMIDAYNNTAARIPGVPEIGRLGPNWGQIQHIELGRIALPVQSAPTQAPPAMSQRFLGPGSMAAAQNAALGGNTTIIVEGSLIAESDLQDRMFDELEAGRVSGRLLPTGA